MLLQQERTCVYYREDDKQFWLEFCECICIGVKEIQNLLEESEYKAGLEQS